ncbi:hypothetical protein AB2M62_00580 [Sphingomonas sp. MMS12-HWE2-04]|uniref:hypothetical protein n=1 Tax=Sphingomonas sp. MMS12-HWE2-04 TaxID=3234199 RepID=UPI00384DF37C
MLGRTLGYGGTEQGRVSAGGYGLTASGLASGNYEIRYIAGNLRRVGRDRVQSDADGSKLRQANLGAC